MHLSECGEFGRAHGLAAYVQSHSVADRTHDIAVPRQGANDLAPWLQHANMFQAHLFSTPSIQRLDPKHRHQASKPSSNTDNHHIACVIIIKSGRACNLTIQAKLATHYSVLTDTYRICVCKYIHIYYIYICTYMHI